MCVCVCLGRAMKKMDPVWGGDPPPLAPPVDPPLGVSEVCRLIGLITTTDNKVAN